jgi:hypothetical protein
MRIRAFALRLVLLVSGLSLIGCTSSAWQTANLSTGSCIRRAKLALRDADFDQNRSMATDGGIEIVAGDHASYRGEVHCPIHDGTIEFTVTGPDFYQAALYKEAIIRKF